jgi:hypothetical protein
VLVSRTTPNPQPGSDEINRAYEEGWVGNDRLAFIGDTLSAQGEKVPELFIVDLPKMSRAGNVRAMRRCRERQNPACAASGRDAASFDLYASEPLSGLVNVPRHWVRSNPQGHRLRF